MDLDSSEHELVRLLVQDGSWDAFTSNWEAQCASYEEDFAQYASASLPVLQEQAENPKLGVAVYALKRTDGTFDAVVHATSAYIPGYDEKVLRVRHMLMSPDFDFGDYDVDTYARLLVRVFVRAASLAKTELLASRHVKFHLRSPAEREFFTALVEPIGDSGIFTGVAIKGAWLHMAFQDDSSTDGE